MIFSPEYQSNNNLLGNILIQLQQQHDNNLLAFLLQLTNNWLYSFRYLCSLILLP